MTDAPQLRPARSDDAALLARLVNYAGEGLPLYLWTGLAGRDETPWDVGRQRAMRKEGGFSYRNATLIEVQGEAAGCLIGYPLAEHAEPIGADLPAMFVPLQELENLAPGTWYVNVLAVVPEQRGKGFGTRLLARAEEAAREQQKNGLSVVVSDANHGARRLYERCGYREAARRRMVKENWQNDGRSWVLLTKSL